MHDILEAKTKGEIREILTFIIGVVSFIIFFSFKVLNYKVSKKSINLLVENSAGAMSIIASGILLILISEKMITTDWAINFEAKLGSAIFVILISVYLLYSGINLLSTRKALYN